MSYHNPTSEEREQQFWARVNKDGPVHPKLGTKCWLWTGTTRKGYGLFTSSRQRMGQAHRYAYERFVGPIPVDNEICHRCDVKICVNYEDHLFVGTHSDNLKDASIKSLTGKISQTQVLEILSLKGTMSQFAIARRFGISQTHVSRILLGKRRYNVPPI